MTEPEDNKTSDEALIKELKEIGYDNKDLWRYFSDRADKLAEQLWTTGTWLLGIVSAVLALPFVAKFVVPDASEILKVESHILTLLVSVFGLLLCGYAYFALDDIRGHIERNWRRANLARTNVWKQSSWIERKLHGWRVLMAFGLAAVAAFIFLAASSLLPCLA